MRRAPSSLVPLIRKLKFKNIGICIWKYWDLAFVFPYYKDYIAESMVEGHATSVWPDRFVKLLGLIPTLFLTLFFLVSIDLNILVYCEVRGEKDIIDIKNFWVF